MAWEGGRGGGGGGGLSYSPHHRAVNIGWLTIPLMGAAKDTPTNSSCNIVLTYKM